MASLAVSRDWWSYRSSLSKKSRASGLTRCWFSLWTKRSHRLRECLQENRPKSGQAGDRDAKSHFLKEQELWQMSSPEGGRCCVHHQNMKQCHCASTRWHSSHSPSTATSAITAPAWPCHDPRQPSGLMLRMDHRPKIAGSDHHLCTQWVPLILVPL